MFGVDIRPWAMPKWDQLIESYAVYDNGKLIGRFIFDSHPRDGKYEHANAIELRKSTTGAVPLGALVMNMPAGNGLMEHGDVVTFLHEYGHLLHGIFGGQNQRWAGLSGVSNEWDFVEAPSQMLENWVYDYDTLKGFAVDSSGKPIPRELVEQMNKARYFSIGMDDMRQLGLSNISLQYYLKPAPANLGDAARAFDGKYELIPLPADSQMQDAFSHLSGYAAAYYTYRWSIVIADDMFTEFQKNGLRDAATAARYRKLVLAPGGSKPSAELVQEFLGRPISLDAYRAKMAKDQ
jgi:thimet oligopeptidase